MKKTNRQPKRQTKYRIGSDDRVTIRGRRWVVSSRSEAGVTLRSANDNGPLYRKEYDWDEISRLLANGMMEIDIGYFSEKSEIERARKRPTKDFELDPEKVLRLKMVATFLSQWDGDDEWTAEQCHRSDEDIERFHDIFVKDPDNQTLIAEARESMIRKGKKKLFVGARQFRRLVERYEEEDLKPNSMADRYAGGGSPGCRLTLPDLQFTLGFLDEARTEDRPTVLSAYIAMKEENEKLRADGSPGHQIVSLSTFQRMFNDDDFRGDVGQSDTKHAVERKYFPAQKGLEVTRPLQIVEMDEHLVHLMAMLVKNRVWKHLHEDVQVRIQKLGRVWLSAALDAYSRSIVGLKVLKGAPDADSAVATLAMVAQHKDRLSALLGTQTGWPQCGTAEAVHTDAGAGYISAKFELAVMMYTGRHRIPPSKHPHLRGRMERFFRTLNQRYIHLFSGQTFSNPLMKGEYDPEKYAHVTDEEFADLIARLIVDCYHNTKHRALGMTPLDAWYRGSQLAHGGVLPPPSPRKYREIFGTTVKRSIGNDGINIAGNIYSSAKLLEIRKKWFRSKLWIRLNEEDISSISVKHRRRNNWIEVPAVFEGLKGVTLEEWQETVRYIDRRFGKNKQHSQEVVGKALAAARKIIALSKQRPGILVHKSLEQKLKEIEADIGPTFRYSQKQEYDYAQYDDGIDYDDDDGDDEELAAERMKRRIDEAPSPERVLPPIATGTNVFNPGAGTKSFDRSGFIDESERATAKDTSVRKPRRAAKSASATPATGGAGSLRNDDVDTPDNRDPEPKPGIRITSNKERRK